MNKALIFLWLLFMQTNLFAQFNPDQSLDSSIHTILVHPEGRPRDLPIMISILAIKIIFIVLN
jgi:hypothetical protein